MEELLKCKDLLKNERVIAAYWALRRRTYWPHKWQGAWTHGNYPVSNDCECYKCSLLKRDWTEKDDCKVPDLILGSLADVAFEMRYACDRLDIDWVAELMELLPVVMIFPQCFLLNKSEPKHWIIAATRACEGTPRNENPTEK